MGIMAHTDNYPEAWELNRRIQKILRNAGIPVFEGLNSAISALSKLAGYHEFLRTAPG
jgi:hypothetical protein